MIILSVVCPQLSKLISSIMKIIITILTIILVPVFAQAQQSETLFSGKSIKWGGFGGPSVGFTQIGGENGIMTGGGGGAIMNFDNGHSIHFGGAGYSLTTNIETTATGSSDKQYLFFSYGGFMMGYTNRTHKLFHLTAQAIIGSGSTGNRNRRIDIDIDADHSFFVFEPSAAIEMNVTNYFRISTGIQYRLISGSSHPTFSDSDLSGFTGMIHFKFGKF